MRSRPTIVALFIAQVLAAQSQVAPPPALSAAPSAVRVPASARITLDGRISEPAWALGNPIADFRQHDPQVGAPATERTEVRVLFDSSTLYIGVQAYDSRPTDVVARILARDQVMSHAPFGSQLFFGGDDAVAILIDPFRDRRNAVVLATNANGAEFDAQVTDQGTEVNVAWRTIWRVAATRNDSGWSAELEIPMRSLRHPDDGRPWGFNVARMIRRKNEMVLWRSWSRDNAGFLKVSEAGELPGIAGLAREGVGLEVKSSVIGRATRGDVYGRRSPADAALDLKYELRPGITIDATANTDFAQADVDAVQVNLTRFSLFFPEKRDFFLENAGVFELGARSDFEPPPWLMFFSRRIGLSSAGEIPVLGGVRLTGREGSQTFGGLHMQTREAFGIGRAGYSVARYKRDVGATGYVGAMYAGVAHSGDRSAHSAAVDFQYWPTSTISVQGFVAGVEDSAAAFGQAHSRVYSVAVDRQVNRWGFKINRVSVGENASPPVGFATRTDLVRNNAQSRLTFQPGAAGLRRIDVYTFANYNARLDDALQDWGVGPAVSASFNSGENVTVYHLKAHTVVDHGFAMAGVIPVPAGGFANGSTGLFFSTSSARRMNAFGGGYRQEFYGGTLNGVSGGASVAFGARGSLGLTRSFNEIALPAGHLVTNVTGLRVGYTMSTRASVTSTLQYDALGRVLFANARLAYMYRPGSELFVVLNQQRDRFSPAQQPAAALVKLTYLARF